VAGHFTEQMQDFGRPHAIVSHPEYLEHQVQWLSAWVVWLRALLLRRALLRLFQVPLLLAVPPSR
jgi:hypothetical protein